MNFVGEYQVFHSYLNILYSGTYGLALGGDRCQPACVHPFKVFTFKRRLCVYIYIYRHIDELENEATPEFKLVAKSES